MTWEEFQMIVDRVLDQCDAAAETPAERARFRFGAVRVWVEVRALLGPDEKKGVVDELQSDSVGV